MEPQFEAVQVPPSAPTPALPASLPLRFAVPPTWPAPSVDWLAANQGWDPPAGWTPVPGADPAPAGWTWWQKDPVGWRAMTAATTSRLRTSIILSSVIFVVGVTLTILTLALQTSFAVVFWGAIVFAPVSAARNIVALRRLTPAFLAVIRQKASVVRQNLDTSSYTDYLGTRPSSPEPFDEFLARRGRESWSFTGEWPADQYHLGVTEQFRLPETAGRRTGLIVRIAVLIVALGIAAALVVSSMSGTSSSASSADGVSSSGAFMPASSNHAGPAVHARFIGDSTPSTADCDSQYGCWVVRASSSKTCDEVTIVVEFSTSKTGDAVRHVRLTSTLIDGTTDVAANAQVESETYADIADAYCSSYTH